MYSDDLRGLADDYLLISLGNLQPFQELMKSCDQRIENLERRICFI